MEMDNAVGLFAGRRSAYRSSASSPQRAMGMDRLISLAPQVGLEPTTLRLTAECSAIELLRSIQAGTTLRCSRFYRKPDALRQTCVPSPGATAFSLLVFTEERLPWRLFLKNRGPRQASLLGWKKSRISPHPPVKSRSENALVQHHGYFVRGESLAWVAGIASPHCSCTILPRCDLLLQHVRQTAQIGSFPAHDEAGG